MIRAALLLALTLATGIASAGSTLSALPKPEISAVEAEWLKMTEALETGKGLLVEAREASEPAAKRDAYHRAEFVFKEARTHWEACRRAWPEDEGLEAVGAQIERFLYECRKCCPMEVKPA